MNETSDTPDGPVDGDGPSDEAVDATLAAAGARLRRGSPPLWAGAIELAALRRRSRRRGVIAIAALVVAGLLAGALVVGRDGGRDVEMASGPAGAPTAAEVDRILAGLDDRPVDPTQVELVSTVSRFADCDALITDLREVGAAHVGSRGFGAFGLGIEEDGFSTVSREVSFAADDGAALSPMANATGSDGVTLGTNVQVAGVDELDVVKAEGSLIYDLGRAGALRITEAATGEVLSTLDVTPERPDEDEGGGASVSDLLLADGRLAIFGSEVEVSDPVEGDPSATQASTSFMTVTFVDATDPAAPAITDRVRIEGGLVSARLVDGEVRLVTTSDMADLGFVMPTTPASVPKALEQNRRSVASSTAPDWIPDWQRDGEDPEPLVPCPQVYVPDTFAGVAMTSMVTFPVATGTFTPEATSLVAPATTLYAGLDTVAISSEVWVDPIDRGELEFDDWQTAVHEFSFSDAAPTYVGSGIVDGSTVGQFAFGEVGDDLGVVTTEGTPWAQDPDVAIDLTILRDDGAGALDPAARVEDLSDGEGEVVAVRFVEGRVLVSTGFFGREVLVVDVSDPAAPRRAGRLTVSGDVGYFHPLPDSRALLVGSRTDEVGEGRDRVTRSWVRAQVVDVADADAPVVVGEWERPWTSDEVGADHHAFTFWPDRSLAMWGLRVSEAGAPDRQNEVAVLRTDGALTEVAVPVVSLAPETAPPCPVVEVTDPEVRSMVGPEGIVLRCDDPDPAPVEWPRHDCFQVDDATVARVVPEDQRGGSFHVCSPAPPPAARRVLVVDGTPILYTDQTLERLDPTTFASTGVTYFPGGGASL